MEGNLAFNPAGDMHHAYPNRANGFCFINDPAVAINYLKQKGYRKILYISLLSMPFLSTGAFWRRGVEAKERATT